MKEYFLGRLFVRLSKAFATLLFLAGCGFSAYLFSQSNLIATEIRYRPNPELEKALKELREDWENAQGLVRRFCSLPPESPANASVHFELPIETEAQFLALESHLVQFNAGREALKDVIVRRFEELTMKLEKKLREHAAELASMIRSESTSKPIAAPDPNPKPTPTDAFESLFDRLPNEEIYGRLAKLHRVHNFLAAVLDEAHLPENRALLENSLKEITNLEKFLPLQRSQESRRDSTPIETPVKVNADTVADFLAGYRKMTREVISNSWVLDRTAKTARNLVHNEQSQCVGASQRIRIIRASAAGMMVSVFVGSLILAFIALVFADLLQSFFDTATNTKRALGAQ